MHKTHSEYQLILSIIFKFIDNPQIKYNLSIVLLASSIFYWFFITFLLLLHPVINTLNLLNILKFI